MLITLLALPLIMSQELSLSPDKVLKWPTPREFVYRLAKDKSDQYKPTLKFTHFNNMGYNLFSFKVYIYKDSQKRMVNASAFRKFVRNACDKHKGNSVEATTQIQAITSTNGSLVYYCGFTDATVKRDEPLKRGQFQNISVAVVQKSSYFFMAIAYSNRLTGKLYRKFLDTLASLEVHRK